MLHQSVASFLQASPLPSLLLRRNFSTTVDPYLCSAELTGRMHSIGAANLGLLDPAIKVGPFLLGKHIHTTLTKRYQLFFHQLHLKDAATPPATSSTASQRCPHKQIFILHSSSSSCYSTSRSPAGNFPSSPFVYSKEVPYCGYLGWSRVE